MISNFFLLLGLFLACMLVLPINMLISNPVPASDVWNYVTRDLTQTQFPYWSSSAVIYEDLTAVTGSSTDIRHYTNTSNKVQIVVVDCYTQDSTAGTYQIIWHEKNNGTKLGGIMTTTANTNGHRQSTFYCVLMPGELVEFWVTNANVSAIPTSRRITGVTL